MDAMRGLLGIGFLLLLAWVLSEDRRRIPWRTVLGGLALQWGLALLLLRAPGTTRVLLALNHVADAVQAASEAGSGFVFGYLGGGALPFAETSPGASYILAFRALPMVLVISMLAARSASMGRWRSARRCMFSWARWRRRCWCGPIWRACSAAKSSR